MEDIKNNIVLKKKCQFCNKLIFENKLRLHERECSKIKNQCVQKES